MHYDQGYKTFMEITEVTDSVNFWDLRDFHSYTGWLLLQWPQAIGPGSCLGAVVWEQQ